ncbi:MAG: tetratricopeptide repeat protein [Pirellulales bacterium]|nr:tetratricopeptide repeat protein [Pirellulales bacterium]
MSDEVKVDFAGSVSSQLPNELTRQLEEDLPKVFFQVCLNEPDPKALDSNMQQPKRIFVSRLFRGYTRKLEERVILGVEVQFRDRYETYIVKIGQKNILEKDYNGWTACTEGRHVTSRIFSPVQLISGFAEDRIAVLYRDAYTLFGLDQDKGRPQTLETVTDWAVCDDRPDPLSVERSIAHIYTDLGRWFFPGAQSNKKDAVSFYRAKLRTKEEATHQILFQWRREFQFRELRRDAVWLICGRDKPDADPYSEPARYLDPVDFVEWMIECEDGSRLPNTLVGRSHGDLHGRNILLGVRRGETEYPAVFDYEDMTPQNVLAWDFAKLEMELKVRLLPNLYDEDEDVRNKLHEVSRIGVVTSSKELKDCPSHALDRARRLAAFLAFEELLDDRTHRIRSRAQAELIRCQPCELQTKVEKLDRLLAILLRIRKEVALWLGYEHHQRIQYWMDEYYFALAVYGLLNVRWNYEPMQTECALIAAGVAAARMPATPTTILYCIDNYKGQKGGGSLGYPSYRVPLSVAHRLWKDKKYDLGRQLLESIVVQQENRAPDGSVINEKDIVNQRRKLKIRDECTHAVPLIAEYALLETECENAALAEPLLDGLRPQAKEFGDFETLGRIGRLFKDSGDRRWEESGTEFQKLKGKPAWQMYQKAFMVYEEAFLATNDYYTGINAATLALLTGETKKAEEYALKVADICSRLKDISRQDLYWLFATEGEAAVIRGKWEDAVEFYTSALAELTPGQGGMADSAYKQLQRLAQALGEDSLRPLLNLFEKSDFAGWLTKEMFRKAPNGSDEGG